MAKTDWRPDAVQRTEYRAVWKEWRGAPSSTPENARLTLTPFVDPKDIRLESRQVYETPWRETPYPN